MMPAVPSVVRSGWSSARPAGRPAFHVRTATGMEAGPHRPPARATRSNNSAACASTPGLTAAAPRTPRPGGEQDVFRSTGWRAARHDHVPSDWAPSLDPPEQLVGPHLVRGLPTNVALGVGEAGRDRFVDDHVAALTAHHRSDYKKEGCEL